MRFVVDVNYNDKFTRIRNVFQIKYSKNEKLA